MEALWLIGVGLVPLAIVHDQGMVGFVEVPKVAVLRTVALFLAALLPLEWALTPGRIRLPEVAFPRRIRPWLADDPCRWVLVAAGGVLLTNLVSVAFSPVRNIGIWGFNPGRDTYSLISYLVIFVVLATHLRTGIQVRRLLWVLTGASVLSSIYGIGQHFGFDPLRAEASAPDRVSLTFGNPIFAASFLLLTIPFTLALMMPVDQRVSPLKHIAWGAASVVLQLTTMLLTLSRGPWMGLGAAVLVFLTLTAWSMGARLALRAAAGGPAHSDGLGRP